MAATALTTINGHPRQATEGKKTLRIGVRVSAPADDYLRIHWRHRGDFGRTIEAALKGFSASKIKASDITRQRPIATSLLVPVSLYDRLHELVLGSGASMACVIDTAVLRYMEKS